MLLSLIVPCYNEQESLPSFLKEVTTVLKLMDCEYELLFINDGSNDHTLKLLKEYSLNDEHIRYISFSRNFKPTVYANNIHLF